MINPDIRLAITWIEMMIYVYSAGSRIGIIRRIQTQKLFEFPSFESIQERP